MDLIKTPVQGDVFTMYCVVAEKGVVIIDSDPGPHQTQLSLDRNPCGAVQYRSIHPSMCDAQIVKAKPCQRDCACPVCTRILQWYCEATVTLAVLSVASFVDDTKAERMKRPMEFVVAWHSPLISMSGRRVGAYVPANLVRHV